MKSVLIVEDLPEAQLWMADVVRAACDGAQLRMTARCDEALALLRCEPFDLALVDLGLPDGDGTDVVGALRHHQPQATSVVVTIHDDDDHLFPALQAGAFGYLLKDQPHEVLVAQLQRMAQGEPPLSPPIARRVLAHFAGGAQRRAALMRQIDDEVHLTERETDVLQRVAKGYTLPEIAQQFGLSRHTVGDHIKQIYKKLNVSSRAEAALEAARRGLVEP
jgi:DNA-binding NarL/FixJ family response regulator